MTRSQDFIWKQRKTLSDGSLFFNPDTTYMPYSEWDKRPVHFLLIFPTPAEVKTVSSTAAAIQDYVEVHCPNVYLDFAYIPNGKDIQLYDKAQIPYCIGITSHLDASHFEFVGFSISVLCEVIGMATIVDSFKRCDKPISLTWTERKDLPLGDQPIIFCGGITAACGDIMYGDLGDGRQAFSDFTYLGECAKLNVIWNRYEEAIKTHVVNRTLEDRTYVGMNSDPVQYDDLCENVITHQDFIDTLFDLRWIYQPQAYEVKMNDKTQIVSNKKINPKAQDWVKPIYPHELAPELGIGRSIIPATGDNTGVSQIQVSEGCSAGGACNFCSEGNYCLPEGSMIKTTEGLKEIQNFKTGDKVVLNGKEYAVQDTVVVGKKPVIRFEMYNHQVEKVANTHLILTIEDGKVKFKRAYEIKEGDFIAYERSVSFGRNKTELAYQIGAVIGDGLFYPDKNLVKVYSPQHEVDFMKRNFIDWSLEKHGEGIWKFVKQTKQVSYELQRIGLTHATAKNKRIPKYFFNADKVTVSSLLKGMFDTDGTISVDRRGRVTVSYCTVSEGLVEDLVKVLSMYGIMATVYSHNSKAHYKYNGEWIKESNGWEVVIFGNENIRRFKEIGFTLPEKQERLNKAVEAAWDVDYVPTFEARIRDQYRKDKEFNRQVRRVNDTLRKTINGWGNLRWLSKRHFEKSIDLLSEDIKEDYEVAKQYNWVQVIDIEVLPEEMMYDINVEDSHAYSLCGWVSHNTGGWTEKSREEILREAWESKKYNAAWTQKMYSFNANYVTNYKGLLYELMKIYPRVTFINMRMEELGKDPDALKMMKLVGSNRLSCPLEGMSPRIMNNFMNKCLSEESIDAVMGYAVHGKMMDVKIGGIFSGYEEDEDYRWMCDFFDKYNQRAQKEGGNFTGRLKFCLTEEALTPFIGKGLVRQKDLFTGQLADAIGTSEVLKVLPQGECKIWKLITTDGTVIRGTGQHPLLVNLNDRNSVESFKFLQDLKQGDKIYARVGTEIYGGYQKFITDGSRYEAKKKYELSEDLAKVFGWYMGDGYLNMYDHQKTFGFCFNNNEQEIYNELWEILVNYGLSPRVHAHKNENIRSFRVHNASWGRAILKQFGHGSHGKIISDLILQSPKSVQCQFIAYWFAADGTIIDDHGLSRVRLESVNEQVLLDLKVMLLNMGITSVVQGHKTKCQGKEFYSYTLEIKRISVEKFVECIKIPGIKGTKIKYKHYNSRIVHNGLWEMIVKSVDFDGYEDTYGLTVKSGTYVTNGVISHNTPLVHYNLTPFEYLERRSAHKSYFGEHWLSDEWYEEFKRHNVHFKVNGFRYSTFIEQSIIDLGRFATPLVYKYVLQKGQKVYSLRSVAYKEVDEVTGKESYPFVDALKAFINPKYFFNMRDPEHYISPSHRIHIDLMGSYIPRARRLCRLAKEGKLLENEPDTRCLKTYEDAKTHCYKFCIKKDPLKIYNDVEMDEEGNLHGDFRLLLGCERCNNPTEQKARLARKVYSTKNSDDLLAFHRLQKAVKVRFFINRKQDYDILNPNNTAYTVLSKFLQQSDNILHAYHSLDGHSMFWCCDPPVNYDVAGLMAVDTWWQYDVTEELQSVTSKVNQNLVASQCVGVRRIMNEEKVKLTDYNVIRFESTLPFDLFTDAVARYDGEIKVVGQGQGFSLEVVKNPNLRPPVVTSLGKVVGYAIVPCRYNPFYYLQSMLGVHKVSETKLANSTLIRNVMIVRDSKNTVCKMCGKEEGLISLASDKILPFGKNCLSKVLLQREVNQRRKLS